jgi:hypothetical protein
LGGYAIIEIQIDDNPLFEGETPVVREIPSWIKNNAGWWADGSIDDDSFVGGIQFLIEEGIMRISS